ncbi:ABC transporter substrate-binding protein [Desulfobacterales bacterium HSG2]|nr:ABC transporter substrate-binding protein [Desulfobacterales bacterium HSG2]
MNEDFGKLKRLIVGIMKRFFVRVVLIMGIITGICGFCPAKDLQVVFLNPGGAKDIGVWHMVSNFMGAAADDLGIQLETIYAERNHIRMLEQAKMIAKRKIQPDYVIMVNEKAAGKQMLSHFKTSGSKIFFIHNGLTIQQRGRIGNEREIVKNWIGTITTDDYQAGYKLIRELCAHSEEEPRILGITGTKATPVSLIRLRGVQDYIKKSGRGVQYQVVYGRWSYEDGKQKARVLLRRYKDANIIWAANDSMASGVFDATKELTEKREILVGGMGGFPIALESIRKGGIKVTAAGHPMIGAWALVLICDYHHGTDFKDDIGVSFKVDHLTLIDSPEDVGQYSRIVLEQPQQIDFRKFSKKFNPNLRKYNFSYDKVVEAAE